MNNAMRINRKIPFIIILLFLSISINSFAHVFEVDGIYYEITSLSEYTCQVTVHEDEYSGDIVIPYKIPFNGKVLNVTAIGNSAFKDSKISSIRIAEGVSTISNAAFRNCDSLRQVTLPNSINNIGQYAFYSCANLDSINLPKELTDIGDYSFAYCTNLCEIKTPSVLNEIKKYSFSGCDNLKTINTSATIIGDNAFSNCTKLDSCILPHNLQIIGNSAFYNTGFKSFVIPNSVTQLGSGAFGSCNLLIDFTIGSGVTYLKGNPIYNCENLNKLIILDSLTPLYCDFSPSSYSNVENFYYDYGAWEHTDCFYVRPGGWSEIKAKHIYIGRDVIMQNKEDYIDRDSYDYTIVTKHYYSEPPFCGNTNIESIIFGESVQYIPNTKILSPKKYPADTQTIFYIKGFLQNCANLKNVILGENITNIPQYTFYNVSNITNIEIPDKIIDIEDFAFYNCSNLSSLLLGENCTSIGYFAFGNCSKLAEIRSLNTTVPNIYNNTFNTETYLYSQVYVPITSLDLYKTDTCWGNFWNISDIESGVEEVYVDEEDYSNALIEIYNLSGLKVGDSTENLAPGVYIKRQGRKVEKIAIQ